MSLGEQNEQHEYLNNSSVHLKGYKCSSKCLF